jgi:O-antigen ligase
MQPASLRAELPVWCAEQSALWAAKIFLRPLQLMIADPSILFLAALTAMLLLHPDVEFYQIDRVAFGVLVLAVVSRGLVLRQRLFVMERATCPMLGLTLLALVSIAGQPFNHETWSVLASKLIVPFTLFHVAGVVFTNERHLRQFEMFAVVILAYLSFTAIAFLCGARSLIFPRFILDETLGIQADRARGPLLQAVANGVSLNMLGLLALHAYRRKGGQNIGLALLLASVPIAILATMTRAVWLSFAGTLVALALLSQNRTLRRALVGWMVVGAAALAIMLSSSRLGEALSDRLEERGPVEFRQAVYAAGWEMFLERPWTGWGFHQMPLELPRYVSGYKEKVFYPHNTYLELMAEHGVGGLSLYLWLMWEMWRLGRGAIPFGEQRGFLDRHFHRLWPVLLAVYWVNAAVVVMSYQFVNGLLFTMAGMLAAQRRRAEGAASC